MSHRRLAAALLVAVSGGWAAASWWRAKDRGAVQGGWTVAEERGCFGCHGAGGVVGLLDPGQGVGGVPTFSSQDVRAYARNPGEVREWILEGRLRRLPDETESGMRAPLLRMPAWKAILSRGEVDALVAYVTAVAGFPTPDDPRIAAGRDVAERLGCFTCHGPGGRGAIPNPRSLKGYIPPWDGPDLVELARDEGEIREWIRDGRPRRLQENPAARFFLDRQAIRMPAYQDQIDTEDLDLIVGYIGWLRGRAAREN